MSISLCVCGHLLVSLVVSLWSWLRHLACIGSCPSPSCRISQTCSVCVMLQKPQSWHLQSHLRLEFRAQAQSLAPVSLLFPEDGVLSASVVAGLVEGPLSPLSPALGMVIVC